ncbi:MAG TPA: GNAT family protein, partial [Thermoleophilia bacterium]|nr:GNAT family protein [Thermoleophilia bacterium]
IEELGLERLELQTYPGNTASQRLAESLGFRREGLLRGVLPVEPGKDRAGRVGLEPRGSSPAGALPPRDDQVLFGLLKDEWLGAPPG